MDLEQLLSIPVYAASRHDQKSSEAPSAVTIVTSAEIERNGWRSLGELLRSVRGFYYSYDRVYGYIGVRGFSPPGDMNTKILLLVDGHRANDELYDQAYVQEEFLLDLDLIERVEVIRGAGSCLYGSDAFFAVINVITRQGRTLDGFELTGEAGSFGARRGGAAYGNRFGNGVELLVSGSLYRADGQDLYFREFDNPGQNNGIAPGIDGERSNHLFAKLTYRDLTLEAARVAREKDVPTSYFGAVFPDSAGWKRDSGYFAEARLDGDYRGTSVGARVSLDHFRSDSEVTLENPLYNPIPPYRLLVADFGRHHTVGTEVKLTRVMRRHTGTVGGEYRNSFRLREETFLKDPHMSILSVNQPSEIWALFLQDEIRIAPGLIVNAGVRHDHYSTFSGTTNPRAALIWSPASATTFKLLYGQAFRAPNAYELYWNDGGASHKANPKLRPERIRTREAVLEQRLGSKLSVMATGYFYNIEDLIAIATDPADGQVWFTNQGEVRAWGAELEALAKWRGGLEGRANCSLQRARDAKTSARVPNSPQFMGKTSAAIPLPIGHLGLGLEGQYFGPREPIRPTHTTRAGGYALFNATLTSRDLVGGTSLSASVYNLFDRRYDDLGAPDYVQELLPQDGRSYRLKLTFRI